MAKKKVKRNPPAKASTAPDPALVKDVAADALAQLESHVAAHESQVNPPGVSTGDGSPVVAYGVGGMAAGAGLLARLDLKKLIPKLVGPVVEMAGMLSDGKISADEARRAGGMVVELVLKLVNEMAAGGDGTSSDPSPAA